MLVVAFYLKFKFRASISESGACLMALGVFVPNELNWMELWVVQAIVSVCVDEKGRNC